MLDRHKNPDGTYNGFTALSEVTGLPIKSVFQIAAEVKANHARLHLCSYHEFSPILPHAVMNQRYRCIECGGEVDFHAHFWHEKGRRAA